MGIDETIWLPDEYGKDTVIYDIFNHPWKTTTQVIATANVWNVVRIFPDEVIKLKKNGSQVFKSINKKKEGDKQYD